MTDAPALLRSMVVYAIALPLAVFLGYLVCDPLSLKTFTTLGLIIFIILAPVFLRFHHPILVLTWNMAGVFFFLPGRPHFWIVAVALSLGISLVRKTFDKRFHFLSAPELTYPLLALAAVILVTAQLTGGIGLQALGSATYGGKKYIYVLAGILGYFALTAHRIPPERAFLYVGLFYLSSLTNLFGDLFQFKVTALMWLYYIFPPTAYTEATTLTETRLVGATAAVAGAFSFLLAKYGVRGIFLSGKPLRALLFCAVCLSGFLGGFRSLIMHLGLVFLILFFLEGLHRTKLLPLFLLLAILAGGLLVEFAQRLPRTAQRALAILPVPIDPEVRQDAQHSSEWRIRMWKAVLPQVPQYLLLGKGYGFSAEEYSYGTALGQTNPDFAESWGATMAGDYHNGPLSVIMPFGVWGALAFVWLLWAGYKVLLRNFRYSDPSLRTVNALLLATYVVKVFMFWFVVGGFNADLPMFLGMLGLSVSLNGGVRKPVPVPTPNMQFGKLQLAPAAGVPVR